MAKQRVELQAESWEAKPRDGWLGREMVGLIERWVAKQREGCKEIAG